MAVTFSNFMVSTQDAEKPQLHFSNIHQNKKVIFLHGAQTNPVLHVTNSCLLINMQIGLICLCCFFRVLSSTKIQMTMIRQQYLHIS